MPRTALTLVACLLVGCASSSHRGLEVRSPAAGSSQYADTRLAHRRASPNPQPVADPEPHNTERYARIDENPFEDVRREPLSTFAIDVDGAAYANVRRFLQQGMLPQPDVVRIEELINYFDYDYAPPAQEQPLPFALHIETASCPWQPGHRLLRVGLKGKQPPVEDRPTSNLVFLIDVSGSMRSPNKLPLLKKAFKMLVGQLGEEDAVAIAVYAGAAGAVLPSTSGAHSGRILAALEDLKAGGSTNGGEGIELAYQLARQSFVPGGINRVILATDGDFNLGPTSDGALTRLIEEQAQSGIFLTVLGLGSGNFNDAMLEEISNRGNGNYHYLDSLQEARRVLVDQVGATLYTIAKDVKLQLEFNPAQVASYRLLGYENRLLGAEEFNDDSKDGGELGAGHTVTALYELVPAGGARGAGVDPLRYQDEAALRAASASGELLTLKLRYKEPEGQQSKLFQMHVQDEGAGWRQASRDFKFAAAVAGFGLLLRKSEHRGSCTPLLVEDLARAGLGDDPSGLRREFLDLLERARQLEL